MKLDISCVRDVLLTVEKYEGFDVAEKDQYYVLRKARDDESNQLYLEMLEKESDGLYIQDIMRGGIKNDDPRIPRNISE